MRKILASSVMVAVIAATCCFGVSIASASGPVFQVTNYDNDGTHGVYVRPTPNLSPETADGAHYVTYGTEVELLCGTSGGPVGPMNNVAWDQVQVLNGPTAGLVGYISEHWLNTPVGPNQHVAGEATCPPVGGSGGTTLSTTAAKAISWATGQLGSAAWNGECLSFARNSYLNAGVDLKSLVSVPWGSGTYPQDIWGHFKGGTTGTGTPPAGALAFYLAKPGKSKIYSHVTLVVDGSGDTISSSDTVNESSVHRETIAQHNSSGAYNYYVGWWMP